MKRVLVLWFSLLAPLAMAPLAFGADLSFSMHTDIGHGSASNSVTLSVPNAVTSGNAFLFRGSGPLTITWHFSGSGANYFAGSFVGGYPAIIDSSNSALGSASRTIPAGNLQLNLTFSTLYSWSEHYAYWGWNGIIPWWYEGDNYYSAWGTDGPDAYYFYPDNTAPNFTLNGSPTAWSPGNGWFSVTGLADTRDDGAEGANGIGLQYSVNGSAWVGFSADTQIPVGTGGNGVYTVRVQSWDALGNVREKSITLLIDNTLPTLSASVPATWVKDTLPVTAVAFADGHSGINAASLGYRVDGGPETAFGTTGFDLNTAALSSGGHTLTLAGSDGAGNRFSVDYPFNVDRTVPALAATVPTAWVRDILNLSSVSFTDGHSGPNAGSLRYTIDGGAPLTLGTNNGVDTSGLSSGEHVVVLTGSDNVGNAAASPSYTFKVDRTGPALSATVPTSWVKDSLTVSNLVFHDQGRSGADTASLRYSVMVQGSPNPFLADQVPSVAGSGFLISTVGWATGEYLLILKGSDLLGNQTVSSSYPFRVDRTQPALGTSVPPWAANSLVVGVSLQDDHSGPLWSSLTYRLDGGTAQSAVLVNGNFTVNTSALAAAGHTLEVTAADTAGNTASSSATFTIDRSGPNLQAAVPSSWVKDSLNITGVSFVDTLSGPDTTTLRYRVDGAAPLVPSLTGSSFSLSTGDLTTGTHTLVLSGADLLGNSGVSPTYTFKVDRTPPTLTLSRTTSEGLRWYFNPQNVFTAGLSAWSDAHSGLRSAGSLDGEWWLDTETPAPGAVTAFDLPAGTITLTLPSALIEGNHTLFLRGYDTAGNAVTTRVYLGIDRTNPDLAVTVSPSVNAQLTGTVSVVQDSGSGIASVTWEIQTLASLVLASGSLPAAAGSFSIPLDPLVVTAEGSYKLVLRAADTAGNLTVVQPSFAVDRTPPTLLATVDPWVNSQLSGQDLVLRDQGTNLATASLAYWFDQETIPRPLTVTAGAFTVSVAALSAEGEHVLHLRGADLAGNLVHLEKRFSIDRTSPVLANLGLVEDGRVLTPADYLQGGIVSLLPQWNDVSMAEYRWVFNTSGQTPQTEAQWGSATWSAWNQASNLTNRTPAALAYLYVQGRDAAGNRSLITERVVRVDDGRPGLTTIRSTTHPYASALTDAVDQTTGQFRLAVTSTGPGGLKTFEWRLYRSAALPQPEGSLIPVSSGTADSSVTLTGLEDNAADEFFWLAARAIGGNGKPGDWAVFSFRVDTKPPTSLRVTSSTHPVPTVAYRGSQVSFQWNEPQDLTGVKSYFYKVTLGDPQQPWSPSATLDETWTASGQTALLVSSLTGSGWVGLEVAAQDWSGHTVYASSLARYDNVKPDWANDGRTLAITGSADLRSATLSWRTGQDDLSTEASGLTYGYRLQEIPSNNEVAHWQYRSSLAPGFQTTWEGLVVGQSYLATVALEDGAGNRQEYSLAFRLVPPGVPEEVPPYSVAFQELWSGWTVSGETQYQNGQIAAQTARLGLTGTPLATVPASSGLNLPLLFPESPRSAVPTLAAAPDAILTWSAHGLSGQAESVSVGNVSGLTLEALTLTLPLRRASGETSTAVRFPQVSVGPGPDFSLQSGEAVLSVGSTIVTQNGWTLTGLERTALVNGGWALTSPTLVHPTSQLFSIANADGLPRSNLALASGAFLAGANLRRAPVDIPMDGLVVSAQGLRIRVVHAVVSDDRLDIVQGYALITGLTEGSSLELNDLTLDNQGHWDRGPAFSSRLVGSILTPHGTLTAETAAFTIVDHQLVLTQGILTRADGSSLVLSNLAMDSAGMLAVSGKVEGDFDRFYSGFRVRGTGGTIVQGIRVFSTVSVDLPVFEASGVVLSGFGIRLSDDVLVRAGEGTGSFLVTTGYGSQSIQASAPRLSADGFTAELAVPLPVTWDGSMLPLGRRALVSDGTVGATSAAIYPTLTFFSHQFLPKTVNLGFDGLSFDGLALVNYAPLGGQSPELAGLTLTANGTVVREGSVQQTFQARWAPWTLEFRALRLGTMGVQGEPFVELPPSLGGVSQQLGTTTLLAKTAEAAEGFANQPTPATVELVISGWYSRASTLAIDAANYLLTDVVVPLPGLMQGQDLKVGAVVVDSAGDLVAVQGVDQVVFRATNGFRVQGTRVTFDPRGLAMGGRIYLPESLGGASVSFLDGQIYLEPDGAVIAESDGSTVSLECGSWPMTAQQVTVDRRGMTIHQAAIFPLGLAALTLPDFTVYSTGELAIDGQSFTSGSFPLPGDAVWVSYSGLRFDDVGVHLSASISLPSSWGASSLDFNDVLLMPDGRISAQTALRDVTIDLDQLGLLAHFDEIRLTGEGFSLSGIAFTVLSGPLEGQQLTIDAARLDYRGQLDLYGFGFAPVDLYGYQVYLDSLSVGPDRFGFTGGLRLSDTLPIPQLQGAYLQLTKFTMDYSGQIQDFEVRLDEGLQFTLYDAWTLGIQGLVIDKEILTVSRATLDLPASFQIGQLEVAGLQINLRTGAITWGEIAVSGAQYAWNGLSFVLNRLSIQPDRGLIFGGSVTLGTQTEDGTPYPVLLQNKTVEVRTLQILPSGLPGTIDASLGPLNGPLFNDDVWLSNATVSFNNTDGVLILGYSGGVKLGSGFLPGLAGRVLTIHDLRIDVASAQLVALNVSMTEGLADWELPGGLIYRPSSLSLVKTGTRDFEVGTSGEFLLGTSFPGVLRSKSITVSAFRMASSGTVLQLDAQLNLPGVSPLLDGLSLVDASIRVAQDGPSLKYSVAGQVQMGTTFPDGLAGLTLQLRTLEWTGSGTVSQADIGTSWTGARSFFGGSSIRDGSIGLSAAGSQWTIGVAGTFRLPSSGLPQGLAGMELVIQSLKFRSDGTILDASIASSELNMPLFGSAQLSRGYLSFSRHDAQSLAITLQGNLKLPSGLPDGLRNQVVQIQNFSFTTKGEVLDMRGALSLNQVIPLFAGVNMIGASLAFSPEGVALVGASISIPKTMFEGLPESIALQKVLIGWDGTLKDLAAGIGQANVKIAGFTTDITNLVVSTRGITIEKAVLTLPPNLGEQKILVLNAGYDISGRFTGVVGVNEVRQEIAGFVLSLKTLTLDVGAGVFRIAATHIKTPQIGSLNADVLLTGVTISKGGVSIGGMAFTLPDYSYGGIGFRHVRLKITVTGNTFEIAGSGQGEIPGLGILDAELSFTTITATYPIGLKRAYFQYTLSSGIPLGTTGLFLNKIRGGITYGPPTDLPGDLSPLFNQYGPRLQLGIGMTSAAGASVLQMDADFWIDLNNAAWAFQGQATVLSGLASGRLAVGYGNNILYGTFRLAIRFAEGEVRIWVFPYNGSTVMSGDGRLTIIVPRGSVISWTVDLGWFGSYSVYIPGSDIRLGGIGAEFGQFNRGAGVKGWISIPCWTDIGAFVDGGGIHFNISDYTLIKPAGYN